MIFVQVIHTVYWIDSVANFSFKTVAERIFVNQLFSVSLWSQIGQAKPYAKPLTTTIAFTIDTVIAMKCCVKTKTKTKIKLIPANSEKILSIIFSVSMSLKQTNTSLGSVCFYPCVYWLSRAWPSASDIVRKRDQRHTQLYYDFSFENWVWIVEIKQEENFECAGLSMCVSMFTTH